MELLHLDVTIFRPTDHSRIYLYVLIDNCSRFIMSMTASLVYSAEICLQNLKNGLQNYCPSNNKLSLLTDGGVEHQGVFGEFVAGQENMRHWIAQQDVAFSNSMAEAANKHLKYQYLFTKEYLDFESVEKDIPVIIESYNHKPHGALLGLTPYEVFIERKIPSHDLFQQAKEQARALRIASNREQPCAGCSP